MIGETFGKLTVSEMSHGRFSGHSYIRYWICACVCGRTRVVAGPELKRGRISACDKRRHVPRDAEYISYSAMKSRCYQKSHKDFSNYGGRGIIVCDRWLNGAGCSTGYECFLLDMGKKPGPEFSIERDDSNGNYEPENCRWATPIEQVLNRRNTRKIAVDGKLVPLAVVCRDRGLSYSLILNRIDRYGMTIEDALTRPLHSKTPVHAERER